MININNLKRVRLNFLKPRYIYFIFLLAFIHFGFNFYENNHNFFPAVLQVLLIYGGLVLLFLISMYTYYSIIPINFRLRLKTIKKTFRWPYFAFFLVFLAIYLLFNLYVNDAFIVLPNLAAYKANFIIPYGFLVLSIAFLVPLNINLIIFKIREIRSLSTGQAVKKEGSMTFLGMIGGFIGGACPGCFVGLLPTLAGIFGLNVALSSLPYHGFEIQIPTLIILLVTTYILTNPLTCKVKLAV